MSEPYYYPGDIIAVKNIKFKDSNTIDTRINGHPVLILNVINDLGEDLYFLKISGTYNNVDGLKNYYILKPNAKNNLYKASYVDLRYVYKISASNIPCYNKNVGSQELKNIIAKLFEVQENREVTDDDFGEFARIYNEMSKDINLN